MSAGRRLPSSFSEAVADHRQDIDAIRAVISDIEFAFNSKDADRSVAHFARNVSVIDVAGRLLSGRDNLREALREELAGPFRDQYARYELADVVFLRADVAIAHKRAVAVNAEGDPLDVGHTMIATYVMVKDRGRWRVASRQATVQRS